MPEHLDEAARAEWQRLVPLLVGRRIVTVADGAVLAEHCQAVADVARYTREVREAGEVVRTVNGHLQRHPLTVLLREARVRLTKTASLLGLTPADRSRVEEAPPPRGSNPFDFVCTPDPADEFFE